MSGLELSVHKVCLDMLSRCAERYGFSLDEARVELGLCRGVVDVDMCVGKGKEEKGKGKGKEKVEKGKGKGKGKEEKVEKGVSSVVRFPFDPLDATCVKEGVCMAVKVNGGLYTQCGGKCADVVDAVLCVGCIGKVKSAAGSVPSHGFIGDRVKKGCDWRDGNGRAPESYVKIMKKNGWSEEFVRSEAVRCGVVLRDVHFMEMSKKRVVSGKVGGKLVDKGNVDEEGSLSCLSVSTQKRRGRPSKVAQLVENEDTTEDLFKTLQREIHGKDLDLSVKVRVSTPLLPVLCVSDIVSDMDKKVSKKVSKEEAKEEAKVVSENVLVDDKELESDVVSEDEEEDEEEETTVLVVKQFTYNGKKYLKSNENTVYTVDTKMPIGKWNVVTRCIEDLPEEDEEEEDEA